MSKLEELKEHNVVPAMFNKFDILLSCIVGSGAIPIIFEI